MTFNIRTLRRILHRHAGLAPWRVNLLSDFREDLHLTDSQIDLTLAEISQLTGLSFPADTAQHLTDVFDLLIHVILRLPETQEADYYYGPIPTKLAEGFLANNYAPTLVVFGSVNLN
ncbi:hypothetical protein [Fibrivirga algicola]|jgi:hypothetical protein|nr:hypothetical protein [Fibrivirga algicola]